MAELMSFHQIRRSDLDSEYSSDESDNFKAELDARFREQIKDSYQQTFGVEEIRWRDTDDKSAFGTVEARRAESGGEEIYEFRLFSNPSKSELASGTNHNPQKIALRSPTPPSGESGFLKPRRPEGYYFTGASSAERLEQYREAAVSGADILEGMRTRWGWALPWRVTNVNLKRSTDSEDFQNLPLSRSSGKKRSGKKRRIAVRKKAALKVAIQSAARQSKAEKEVAEKEKRNRRNREKKVKRRQKERLKKSMPD